MKTARFWVIIPLLLAGIAGQAAAEDANPGQVAGSRPVTNLTAPELTPDERREALSAAVAKLQRERDELLSAPGDPASPEAADIQKAVAAKDRKINKLKSELLKIPAY